MRARLAEERGFATLELRIVLVIIGVVLLVPITSFAAMRRQASDSTARASLNVAVTQVEAHHVLYGTYSGLTSSALDARESRRQRYTVTDLSETTYCISSKVGGRSWMKSGPTGRIVEGACSSSETLGR